MTKFIKKLAAFSLLFAAALFGTLAHAGPVIENGSFETADFTGWTVSGDTGYTAVDIGLPHGGDYSAFFGEQGAPSTITQALATEAGHSYVVKFWLANLGGSINNADTVNLFEVFVANNSQFSLSDKSSADYAEYSVQFTAASDSTDLAFSFLHDDTFWILDDVSIGELPPNTQVPEPGTLLLFSTALGLISLRRKRR